MRYSALTNGVTLKPEFGVVQGHWQWRCSIDHDFNRMVGSLSIALSCTISSYLTLNNIVILKSGVRGHSRSLKLVPFESLGTVSNSPSIVTGSISYHFRDKARYWSKITIFHTPLHSTSPPLASVIFGTQFSYAAHSFCADISKKLIADRYGKVRVLWSLFRLSVMFTRTLRSYFVTVVGGSSYSSIVQCQMSSKYSRWHDLAVGSFRWAIWRLDWKCIFRR